VAEAAREESGAGPIVRAFGDAIPRIHRTAWLATGCVVVGDVEIGADSSVWYGAVLRGDVESIRIGARTNLQDQVVVHVTRDTHPAVVGDEVTVGHRAVVHGCRIGDGALIGIGACVLDGASVGEGALVGAGAVVTPGVTIPRGMVAMGTPARVVRELGPEERNLQIERTLQYVETARIHARSRSLDAGSVRGDREREERQ
jgi:carbonic anhydrase/acetyltransferase-like protein (isoleucine patch superfamily)